MLHDWYSQNTHKIAGLDEAGRGPLAGPVVAAAVVLDPQKPISLLNDSKKLTEKRREALFDEIQTHALGVGFFVSEPAEIDELNILRASLLAMRRAMDAIPRSIRSDLIGALVDGNQRAPLASHIQQHTVVGGDAIFAPIMAASIIAKVTRDRLMVGYGAKFPEYGFEKHKGYGTKAHTEAIRTHGPCDIHRKTFQPVRGMLEAAKEKAARHSGDWQQVRGSSLPLFGEEGL